MKNIILLLVACIGMSVNAQQKKTTAPAQQKNVDAIEMLSPEETGKKNLAELSAFTTLNQDQKNLLVELFTTKAKMRKDIDSNSPERLTVLGQSITSKMESILPSQTMDKIKANKTLYLKLIN